MKKNLFFLFLFFLLVFFSPKKILADHACYQSCGTPSYCDSGLTCVSGICKNAACPDQTDCTCDYPNCKNLTGQTTLVLGNTYTYSATYENYYGPVTSRGFVVLPTDCNWSTAQTNQTLLGGEGTLNWSWTPNQAGTFTAFCRAWNDGIAECRGDCVDGPPRYSCPGPVAKMTVTVITPTPTPTPTPYPTVAISGNLKEYLGALCSNNISTNNLSLNINPQYPAGITTACGITPPTGQTKSSYRCTVVFDNQNAAPTPAQNLNLSAFATNYSSAYWTDANACSNTANNSLPVNVSSGGSTVYNKDIFFKNISPWIKLKNNSFTSSVNLTNPLPLAITAYDSDDNTQRYFIIGNDAGLVTASSIDTGTADVSSKDWKANYSRQIALTPSDFLNYIKSRKEYTVITHPDLSEITSSGIYVYNGPLTLTSSNIAVSNIVIIATGNVAISGNQFNIASNCIDTTGSKNIAILSTGTLTFSNTTQCAAGIFIAPTIDTGSTSNQGLKIKGNLIALTTLNQNRSWSDNSKPSVFIVFNPTQYINLLPYLSTATYDFQQAQ
jgi:hypothetical protein